MEIPITALVVFSLLFLVLVYVVITLYRKNDFLIEKLETVYSNQENYLTFFRNLLETYVGVYAKLKRVDRRGSFESDDEIGFTYRAIRNTIGELHDQLQQIKTEMENDDNKTEEKKEE